MIVCICNTINDREIHRAVRDGHDSFDALQFELGIGLNCGKCVGAACEVLCEARAAAGAGVGANVTRSDTRGVVASAPVLATRRTVSQALARS